MRYHGLAQSAHGRRLPGLTLSSETSLFLAALLVGGLLGATSDAARAQSGHDFLRRPALRELGRNLHGFAPGDTIEIVARRRLLPPGLSSVAGSRLPEHAPLGVQRPVPTSLFLRPRQVEMSRFACLIYGADMGAGTASALGGIGLVSGLCGEKTAGYLIGAGAVLGALWGGTAGADDPRFRIRIGAGPSDADPHALTPEERERRDR